MVDGNGSTRFIKRCLRSHTDDNYGSEDNCIHQHSQNQTVNQLAREVHCTWLKADTRTFTTHRSQCMKMHEHMVGTHGYQHSYCTCTNGRDTQVTMHNVYMWTNQAYVFHLSILRITSCRRTLDKFMHGG